MQGQQLITRSKEPDTNNGLASVSLTEELSSIELPRSSRLFVRTGLPNVFGELLADPEENPWLFVPDNILSTIEQQSDNNSDIITVDAYELYPVVFENQVLAIVAIVSHSSSGLSRHTADSLKQALLESNAFDKKAVMQISKQFVSELFDFRQSYSELINKLLGLMTDQAAHSHAAMYWVEDNNLYRRWSKGDLLLSDKLALTLHGEHVVRWTSALQTGRAIIPAEIVESEPVFMEKPPNFIALFEAPTYADRRQILAIAITGETELADIEKIKQISKLFGVCNGSKMTNYTQLAKLFGESPHRQAQGGYEQALIEAFKILDDKVRIESICLLESDNIAALCIKNSQNEHEVTRKTVTEITDDLSAIINGKKSILVIHENDSTESENRDTEKAVCRVFMKVPIRGGTDSIMRIEYYGETKHALELEELFVMIASFLGVSLSLQLSGTKGEKYIGNDFKSDQDMDSVNRLRTMDKITGGYFHEFVECLSVILGQVQIMQYEMGNNSPAVTTDHLLSSADRINQAALTLASGINKVREMSIFSSNDTGRFVSADKFLKVLPSLTYGYSAAVKESKNLELIVQSQSDARIALPLPVLHIYDYILPLILILMDEAICSGRILVSLTEYFGRPALRISFARNMIGKLDFEKLTQQLFVKFDTAVSDNDFLEFSYDGAEFIFKEETSGQCQVIYKLSSKAFPVEETAY
ncbi:MAG: hypothetical protein IH931_06985 [candidate division Zixibacteria bacterium]|nr:hypothetical protein [candidate division Zixibacteria bacterium]